MLRSRKLNKDLGEFDRMQIHVMGETLRPNKSAVRKFAITHLLFRDATIKSAGREAQVRLHPFRLSQIPDKH